jgi:hypothetical protein
VQLCGCREGTVGASLVFAQGRKRIKIGGTAYLCDASSFVVSSIDVPVESQIVEASEEVPLLSMLSGSTCRSYGAALTSRRAGLRS